MFNIENFFPSFFGEGWYKCDQFFLDTILRTLRVKAFKWLLILIQSRKYTTMPTYYTVFSHPVISVSRKDLVSSFSIINCCSAGLSDWKPQTMNASIQRRNTAQMLWKDEPYFHPPFTHTYHPILSLTLSQRDLLGNDWIVSSLLLFGDFWPQQVHSYSKRELWFWLYPVVAALESSSLFHTEPPSAGNSCQVQLRFIWNNIPKFEGFCSLFSVFN